MLVEPGWFRTAFLAKEGESKSAHHNEVPAAPAAWPIQRIPDYESTNIDLVNFYRGRDGDQIGDPDKAGQVLFELVNKEDKLPKWLLMGSDAVDWAKVVAKTHADEIEQWQEVGVNTDGNW